MNNDDKGVFFKHFRAFISQTEQEEDRKKKGPMKEDRREKRRGGRGEM
jgi:hypothetical protein